MQLDKNRWKDTIRRITKDLKELEIELEAYREAFANLKRLYGDDPLNVALQLALHDPMLQDKMNRKYDGPLQELLRKIDLEEDFAKSIESWNRNTPAN
jgi:hypothetical protein